MENDKIIVEIASYRDPELLNTINSAIIQADNPKRITFAVCLQSNDTDVLKVLKQMNNVRVKYMKEEDARGSCYARYLCQQLIEDEKYIYQVDSHMRFIKHWDTRMIEQLLSLNDPKASISFYPPHCKDDMLALPLDDETFDKPCAGGKMHTYGFTPDEKHFLKSGCNPTLYDLEKEPILKKNPFISAGNFFSFADIHREILHDYNMYFYGDELPMAIRYFTNGWNNYCSTHCYVYHRYEKPDLKWPERPAKYKSEDVRFEELLNLDGKNKDMEGFGLGNVRTLKEFEEFAGIYFKDRIVTIAAETGIFDNPELKKKISLLKDRNHKEELFRERQEKIEVIIIDPFNNYKECINSLLYTATYKDNISVLLATKNKVSKNDKEKFHIKEILKIDNDFSYCDALSKLVDKLDDSYALIVDSAVRFIENWDKYNLNELKKCGKNSALTSWVWYKGKSKDEITGYFNILKKVESFYYSMPIYKYDESVNLEKRKTPYRDPLISDGLLFCHSSILKRVEIDPNLRYDEHLYLYSLRLYTNGIDVYYPTSSLFYRIKEQDELNIDEHHYGVVSSLSGINDYYSRQQEAGYKYDIGDERPLFDWYDALEYDISNNRDYELY